MLHIQQGKIEMMRQNWKFEKGGLPPELQS